MNLVLFNLKVILHESICYRRTQNAIEDIKRLGCRKIGEQKKGARKCHAKQSSFHVVLFGGSIPHIPCLCHFLDMHIGKSYFNLFEIGKCNDTVAARKYLLPQINA